MLDLNTTEKQLHANEYYQSRELFDGFRPVNARAPGLLYTAVDVYSDARGFLAVLPDVLLRACFRNSSKYRASLFGLLAVLQRGEAGQNFAVTLHDKRIFDYFAADVPRFAAQQRLGPAAPGAKNQLKNAQLLLKVVRLWAPRSVVFEHEPQVPAAAARMMQIMPQDRLLYDFAAGAARNGYVEPIQKPRDDLSIAAAEEQLAASAALIDEALSRIEGEVSGAEGGTERVVTKGRSLARTRKAAGAKNGIKVEGQDAAQAKA